MMTLESYLNVGYLWHAEQQVGYNPFDNGEFDDDESMVIGPDGVRKEDGWIDYPDIVTKVEPTPA